MTGSPCRASSLLRSPVDGFGRVYHPHGHPVGPLRVEVFKALHPRRQQGLFGFHDAFVLVEGGFVRKVTVSELQQDWNA